ncbi:MAG: hypothetical protein ACYCW6_20540 [Candidatus Xenobia bacterium]
MLPADFPAMDLAELLQRTLQEHGGAAEQPGEVEATDENVTVRLRSFSWGPMVLRLQLEIANDKGDLGVPLEAELFDERQRFPLARAEAPWWPEAEGTAVLLAPTPLKAARLTLRIRQVRLFTLGPGSRAMKVRVLAPRPIQPPPVKLSPGEEEWYRWQNMPPRLQEKHQDVSGYWDLEVTLLPRPSLEAWPIDATLALPGGRVHLTARTQFSLTGQHSLDFADAYRHPTPWDGFSSITVNGKHYGVGTLTPDGLAGWQFPEPVPENGTITDLRLFRLPAVPPLPASPTLKAPPVLPERKCEVEVSGVEHRAIIPGLPPVLAEMLDEATRKRLVQHFLHGRYQVKLEENGLRIRPWVRFHSQGATFEGTPFWGTPPGELYVPVSEDTPLPSRWEVPFVTLLQRYSVAYGNAAQPASTGRAWLPPWLYAINPRGG